MRRALATSVMSAMWLFGTPFSIAATADTGAPFAGATAASLAARDPHLRRLRGASKSGTEYAAAEGGRGFVGTEVPVLGRVGATSTPIALVALETGGTVGPAAWLAYVPDRAAHVAVLRAGSDAFVRSGAVVVRSKMYDPNSPDCCPRRVRLTTYAWRHGNLIQSDTRVVSASQNP